MARAQVTWAEFQHDPSWSGGSNGSTGSVNRDIRITGAAGRFAQVTWAEFEINSEGSGGSSGSNAVLERDLRIFGAPTPDESVIPVTVLLGSAQNTTRDIRISGVNPVTTTRDLRITGITPQFTERTIRLNNAISIDDSTNRDIRISGVDPRRAVVTWTEIFIIAGTDSEISRDIRLTGAGVNQIVTRDIRVTGGLPWVAATLTYRSAVVEANTDRDIRITGKLDANTSRDVRVSAHGVTNISNDIRIRGQQSIVDSRDIRIVGQNTTNTTRDLRVRAQADAIRANDLRITGQLSTLTTRDIRVTGVASINASRDLKISGQADSNAIRDLRITGQLSSQDLRDIRTSGKLDVSTTRDLRMDTVGVTYTTRDILIISLDANSVERDIRASGEVAVNTAINARINGSLSITSPAYDLRVSGTGLSEWAQDICITGAPETLDSTERDIRIEGRAVEVARPDGVITNNGWVAVPSGTLYSTIDEIISDDSDFMKSPPDIMDLGSSTQFNAAQTAIITCVDHYPLTEASAPFGSTESGRTLNTVIGSPTVSSSGELCFLGESYLQMDSGDGVRGTTGAVDPNALALSGWFWIDELPASTVHMLAFGESTDSSWQGIALRSDGKITWLKNGTEYGSPSTVLETGKWHFLGFSFNPSAGGGPRLDVTIDGVVVINNQSTGGFGGVIFNPGIRVGGTGFVGRAAHVAVYDQINSVTQIAPLYQYRAGDLSTPKAAEVSLSNVTAPLIKKFHTVRYRIAASQSPSHIKLTVVLLQGATEIASWEHTGLDAAAETFAHELSEAEASTITDYTDLRLRFIAARWLSEMSRDIRVVGE